MRPALVSNPMAATNWRSVAHTRLVRRMPDPLSAVSTPSVADLPRALDYVLFQRQRNVLVVNGGDGTIHHVVNAAVRLTRRTSRQLGARVPLPVFLFVNGGGMNMVARAVGARGHPVRTLSRFVARGRWATLGELKIRPLGLLAVTVSPSPPSRDGSAEGQAGPDGDSTRYGLIFGTRMVHDALTMYERFGRGYRGLGRFLGAVATGPALQTPLWRRFRHLIEPPGSPLWVDGEPVAPYAAAVATTIPMTLLGGAVRAVPWQSAPGGFTAVVVTAQGERQLIGAIPGLLRARPGRGYRYVRGAHELDARGAFTLDGELLSRPPGGPGDDGAHLRVRGSDLAVRAVSVG